MGQNIDERVNDIMAMSTEELIDALPPFFDEIRKNGVAKSMEESPALLYQLLTKLEDSDLLKIGADAPEILDNVMKIVWEGAEKRSESVATYLEQIVSDLPRKTFVANFETFDTALKTHFVVSGGRISGDVGMTTFREQDCRLFGDTKTILALLRGEFRQTKLYNEELFFEGAIGLMGKKAVPLCALIGSLLM